MTTTDDILLREAVERDAEAISALVIALAKRWIAPDCTDEGIALLLGSMAPSKVRERLHEGHRHVLAQCDGRIVGVATLRLPSHLYYLFVADDMQRRGIARRLWNAVRTSAPADAVVTVNAALHAMAAYRRLGFETAGPERFERGIRSMPMTWTPR